MIRQKITPFLWFDGKAEEAARFYVSLFPDSVVTGVTPGPGGVALVVEFRLAGLQFLALNGGPQFKFNEAISLSIDCHSQAEVDELWEKLSTGGSKSQCGWLKDKYGLSWQVVPAVLPTLLGSADRAKAARVMGAMMKMTKLDIQALQDAADGK
ncbi:VOC family protein [Fimbriiglobus ruber]|uniref:3-demethylubiquinone-9 3-methyltransferase n=1 Tax=Fimbriiglobus ruber TaxID=1908690 RepID=A0A225DGC0_9BACT|nr:VOC family protein [Fimbriiglobus ruber]OWK37568.1 3-demethylubiquinone-9 3-methyltransferase [Fimbriiglobus ruber]